MSQRDTKPRNGQPSWLDGPGGRRLGLGLTAASGLLFELALTRVLSVTLWYNFAFLIISLALLGFGMSGVLLATVPAVRRQSVGRLAATYAVVCPLSYVVLNRIPFEPFSASTDPSQYGLAVLFVLCATLPFVFAGLVIGSVFNEAPQDMGRLYAWDLVGAALGAAAMAVVVPALGAPGTLMAASLLAGLGAAVFSLVDAPKGATGIAVVGVPGLIALVAAVVSGVLCITVDDVMPLRMTSNKPYAEYILDPKPGHITRWNTMSRVDVLAPPLRPPHAAPMLIDGGTAVTIAPAGGRIATPHLVPAMSLGAKSSMLIIGSGGGAEVSIARKLGASRIVAVEVNPAINEIATGPLGEWTGHVFDHPSVELHTDEGRSFLERQDRRFGLIISAHTISNAAVASGAMALSENHLFTVEAFEDYLAHLDENGLLVVTRPEFQLPRLLVMADAALRAAGHTQGLEGRLLAYRAGKKEASGYGFTACIIIAPNGFSEQQYTLFDKHMGRPNLSPIWDRKGVADSKDALLLQAIVAGPDDAELARLASESERELSLATDDRPFFNQTMPWSSIDLENIETFLGQNEKARIALEEQPVAQLSLLLVLGSGCLVALLGLVVAVLLCRPREIHGLPTASLYFAALGLGFMLVEVSMIQKLTLLVGQPTHTLVVCLAGILVFSGLGSWFSYKIGDGLAKAIATKAAIAAGSVVAFALIADLVVELAIGMPTAARMAVALGLTAAPAFFMGYLFPMGMRGLAATQPNPSVSQRALGFVWGVNGFFSVLGSVLATTLAMVTGFRLVLLIGALIYALAAYAGYTALKPTTTG